MDILLMIHSIVRWLLVLVTVITLVKFAIGWLQKSSFTSLDARLFDAFLGLITLQWVLGLILLIGMEMVRFRLEHAFMMTVAVGVAHMGNRWRKAEEAIKFRNFTIILLVVMLLVFVGVMVIPGGWSL
jgi:hypothetical protein